MDRRTFLKTTAAGGAVVGLGVGAPGCGNDVVAAPLIDVALNDMTALSSFNAPTGLVLVKLGAYPDLNRVGGAVTLRLPTVDPNLLGYPLPPDNNILLVQWGAQSFSALQSTCPHAACPLGYNKTDMKIECPCHGSRFVPIADVNDPKSCPGQVTHGPANGPLLAWTAKYSAQTDQVGVDLTSTIPCNPPLPPVAGGVLTLPFADFPTLTMPGGSVVGSLQGKPDPLLVVRVDATTAAALDARCTHLGCTVDYSAKNGDVECPCHGSVFGLDGKVQVGPAVTPLPSFGATVMADSIVVTGL